VRGLAVTGAKRSPVFPEVPTLIESGVAGYEATTWHGVVVPAGTPKAIVALLNTRLNRAVNSTAATERILALGSEPLTGTPEAFWELVRIDSAKWAEVIRKAGAKID
jgi:tripartite-type tricarboxylate transporter receptor subunit TctC